VSIGEGTRAGVWMVRVAVVARQVLQQNANGSAMSLVHLCSM